MLFQFLDIKTLFTLLCTALYNNKKMKEKKREKNGVLHFGNGDQRVKLRCHFGRNGRREKLKPPPFSLTIRSEPFFLVDVCP